MARPRSHGSPSPGVSAGIVIAILALLIIPAAFTLHAVHIPSKPVFDIQNPSPNPSPHGYTWSLLLFIVPIIAIGGWFVPSEGLKIPQRAFAWTIGILVPMGFLLDFIFAHWFFTFQNEGATLGIHAPAVGRPVPIEEYFFYLTGFVMILLLYVWLSEYWLAAYTVPDYAGEAERLERLLRFHPTSLVSGVALIAVALLYRKMFTSTHDGWPAYFTVLVIGGLVPSISFFPVARRFINWRAFSLTMLITMLISLLWEATLAMPYAWWGYQSRWMIGLFIGAWGGLPIEAVLVWIAVTYGTVIVFEIIKLQQASGRPAREALTGRRRVPVVFR